MQKDQTQLGEKNELLKIEEEEKKEQADSIQNSIKAYNMYLQFLTERGAYKMPGAWTDRYKQLSVFFAEIFDDPDNTEKYKKFIQNLIQTIQASFNNPLSAADMQKLCIALSTYLQDRNNTGGIMGELGNKRASYIAAISEKIRQYRSYFYNGRLSPELQVTTIYAKNKLPSTIANLMKIIGIEEDIPSSRDIQEYVDEAYMKDVFIHTSHVDMLDDIVDAG